MRRSEIMNFSRMQKFAAISAAALGLVLPNNSLAARQFEYLDRGVVAVRQSEKNAFVSWRSLATDDPELGFNVYRTTDGNTVKLNENPLFGGTNFLDSTADFSKSNVYFVRKVLNGIELKTKGKFTMPAGKAIGPYITIPVSQISSTVHFVWVGDLDGDGAYDYVLDQPGLETQQIQAYNSLGEHLWTVDLGENSANKNNISPGAATVDVGMWDGVTVYDIDMDGYAEVIIRVADGVIFGDGKKHSENVTNAQSIAVLDGRSGALKYLASVPSDYISVGPLAAMMEIGYLDGKTPSLICWMKNRNSDKSFNSLTVAYHVKNGKFVQQWKYDAGKNGGGAEAHQIRVADVDYDGKDEVLHQGYALNGDGTLRYQIPLINHGDRWYVGAFKKGDSEMMGYGIQQDHPNNLLEYFYNASTGKILWTHYGDESCNGQCDVARGNVGDIDPNYDGLEIWSFQGIYSNDNQQISSNYLYPVLRYWWDGDLAAESYNDGKIEKWNYESKSVGRLATTWKIYSSSGSDRGVAMFHGDILGDWREESILVNYEKKELVIFTTDISTDEQIYSLMQNPCYRNGTTAKGYVQASMLDYFLGYGMEKPPVPDVEIIGGLREPEFSARAFLKKCGAGSRFQEVLAGDSIEPFCFQYGGGNFSVKGLPAGISTEEIVSENGTEVWFRGAVLEFNSDAYEWTIEISGIQNDTAVTGSFRQKSTTALSKPELKDWRIVADGGFSQFVNGSVPAKICMFDLNGKLLLSADLGIAESLQLPQRKGISLLLVETAGQKIMQKIRPNP